MSVPTEWRDMMSDIQDILVDNCVMISKYANDSEKDDFMKEMSTTMKEVCEMNKNFADEKNAIHYCQNINIEEAEEEVDYNAIYQKELANVKKAKKYNAETDQLYKEFKEKVDDLTSNDFEMEEIDMNFLDPITKQIMKQPVKSHTCGHIFDRDSINTMFSMSRFPYISCPYIGCPAKLKTKDIQEDQVISQKFQRFLNSQKS